MTRARYPDETGFVGATGARVHYEIYGDGETTVYLLPTWQIVHARCWKGQIPYLSRHYRVITSDHLGSGHSDRPEGLEHYSWMAEVRDAVAVMDATETEKAVVIGASNGGHLCVMLAALHPDRIQAIIPIGVASPFGPEHEHYPEDFESLRESYEGWNRWNANFMRQNYGEFSEWFLAQCLPEPHSTKQLEDLVGWSQETTPHVLINSLNARNDGGNESLLRAITCPSLWVHGANDLIEPLEKSRTLSRLCGGRLLEMEGSGHAPQGRIPAKMNLIFKSFIDEVTGKTEVSGATRATELKATKARKRALYLSSPIGLGHARRDLAIARALRRHHPDLEIDWLAQHPVTAFLEATGERVHPGSSVLANESQHLEAEADGHDLHVFEAYRRMDEILVANFMVFQEIVAEGAYDLILGDEAWDVDYFWHEHPELKKAQLAWFTDFVGFLPMPEKGERDAFLTADYNAEMVEHVAAHPNLRDRAIFVGSPEDCVDMAMGPDLPRIREWTEQNFDFSGYITGFDPDEFGERTALRSELGYRPEEKVVIVTVGGSGIGLPLLRRVVEAYPLAKHQAPALRMIVVAGPRIDPAVLAAPEGVTVRAFIPDLPKHLAACDLAVVQGGLTTCMELTAAGTPFIYVPIQNHFEQNFHVHHRLQRYRAGRRMDYADCNPDSLGAAMLEELGRQTHYLPVETNGAAKAAAMLAEML